MKDPAFLFYSNDFYGGTRTMLPEERACYMDLMIYQHQYGIIPNDLKRVLMFCSGIDKATLEAVLEAKFKRCEAGWYNERLSEELEKRREYTESQSVNGTIGQFWKKVKMEVKSDKEYQKIRKSLSHLTKQELFYFLNQFNNQDNTSIKAVLQAVLEASLKHLENEIENEIENENKEKGIIKGKNIPAFEQFRQAYPGTKRGHEIEFKVLQKHDDWKEVLPKLMLALQKEISWRQRAKEAGVWTPGWANLQTWLNQRRWEQEFKEIETEVSPTVSPPPVVRSVSTEEQIRQQFGQDADPRDYFFNAKTNRYEKLPYAN